jgi:hypothetical protein
MDNKIQPYNQNIVPLSQYVEIHNALFPSLYSLEINPPWLKHKPNHDKL